MIGFKYAMQYCPLVSVVMTVFNGSAHLSETIESILRQTLADFEFIIVDDGSTDSSVEMIRRYAALDARIQPILGAHRGHGAAANHGIAGARGAYIARMDHDDIALPERLAAQIDWMSRRSVDVCGSQVQTFGIEEAVWWFPETHAAIQNELLFRASLMQPSVVVRTEILRENPYHERAIYDDYELWTRLALRYTLGNVSEVLLRYRRHAKQTHIVEARLFSEDFLRYRFRYFYARYPDSSLSDYLALARISDRLPATSLRELERIGQWVSELAQPAETRFRARMAERWHETCDRSAGLGHGVAEIRERFRQKLAELSSGSIR